jgi:hypothetical protein
MNIIQLKDMMIAVVELDLEKVKATLQEAGEAPAIFGNIKAADTDEELLLSMHKVRAWMPGMPADAAEESRLWLKNHEEARCSSKT